MLNRRVFLGGLSAAVLRGATLSSKERVDRVLASKDPDRHPFSLWQHFHLEAQGPEAHAAKTLDFHRLCGTDLVKVMSDFPFPKPSGEWWQLKSLASPFAPQLRALEIVRDGLTGKAHFVETIFNPWNVAEKLSSKEAVAGMMRTQPQRLLDALEAIAKSEANHAKLALSRGASGIFLAIANAQTGILTPAEYRKFSEPFDRMVLDAAHSAPLNILHLHGDKVHLDLFWKGWPGSINYSAAETGLPLAKARAQYAGLLIGGLDQRYYRTQSVGEIQREIAEASRAAGKRFLVTPGCSVPDETRPEELTKLRKALNA